MKIVRRTGLLGGTFNPVHKGHVDLGTRVLEEFRLDRILYILSARPPHKTKSDLAPVPLRWEMLSEALKPFDQLEPCDIEIKRENYSWTIDTLSQLKNNYPDDQFYFISGSEGFLKIKTWKQYRKILDSTCFIIVMRGENQQEEVSSLLKSENIRTKTGKSKNHGTPSAYFFSYSSDKLAISSTIVRDRIRKGKSVENLVNSKVKKIIEEHKLYG